MSRMTLWRVMAVAMPVLGALAAPLPTVDLTYQLRAGAEILDTGAIPSIDTWTFTIAGSPWLDQQWGGQVLLTLVSRLGGWTGLVLLRAALVGLACGLLLLAIRRQAPALGPRPAALVVIGAFVVAALALALRPQLFAIDLFAATLVVLAVRDDRPRLVWLIPILAAAWANLHGTFPLVLVLCGLAWLEDLARPTPSAGNPRPTALARHRMLLVGLAAAAATLVTPFGLAAWGYVANLATNPTIANRVSEWQPPSPLTVPGAILWLSIAAVVVLVVVQVHRAVLDGVRLRGAMPWPRLVALLLFGGFAMVSGRGTAWWPFVAAFVVAPWLAAGPTAAPVDQPERPTPALLRRVNVTIVGGLALAGIALLPAWRPIGPAGVPQGTLSYAPQGLAAGLQRLPERFSLHRQLRVWNPQEWGSWLEFAAPAFSYALDSRIELFPASAWDEADAIRAGALDLLDRYEADVVVTDRQADVALEAVLGASADWTAVVECPEGTIWLLVSGRGEPARPSGTSGGDEAGGYGTSVCQ